MIAKIEASAQGTQEMEDHMELIAVPLDDTEDIGADLISFCGDLQMFKLTAGEEDEQPMMRHYGGDSHHG